MPLRAAVYVAPSIPFQNIRRSPPTGYLWSPISCTLIYGEKDAVLVDTPITTAQTEGLADWIEVTAPGRRLSTVYITHGHADHWLGLPTLQRRFPGLKALATAGTIEHMKKSVSPTLQESIWGKFFPGQLDEDYILADPLPQGNSFYLEGQLLEAVEVGHSDTYNTTVLWVPDLKLTVCGDVVYGEVHQMLAEAKTPALQAEWIAAVEKIEALGPEMVVAGHKRPGEMDGVYHLANTKKYLQDFRRLAQSSSNADELERQMLELYPNRYNPFVLRWGADANFQSRNRL